MKRDDQILAYRLQNEEARNRMAKSAKDRDRALAMAKTELPLPEPEPEANGDTAMEDANGESTQELVGSKTIVMHVGSQNLRIGLASDALPKTTPMVIARKSHENEAEEDGGEPRPKRLKLDDGQLMEPEKMFGPEVRYMQASSISELSLTKKFLRTVCVAVHHDVCRTQNTYARKQEENTPELERNGGQL